MPTKGNIVMQTRTIVRYDDTVKVFKPDEEKTFDEITAVNLTVITKLGVRLAEVSEQFVRRE